MMNIIRWSQYPLCENVGRLYRVENIRQRGNCEDRERSAADYWCGGNYWTGDIGEHEGGVDSPVDEGAWVDA